MKLALAIFVVSLVFPPLWPFALWELYTYVPYAKRGINYCFWSLVKWCDSLDFFLRDPPMINVPAHIRAQWKQEYEEKVAGYCQIQQNGIISVVSSEVIQELTAGSPLLAEGISLARAMVDSGIVSALLNSLLSANTLNTSRMLI